MKNWVDLTDQEKQEMTQVITKFMDIMDTNALDPVGDVFKDAYLGVVKESLDKTAKEVLEEFK